MSSIEELKRDKTKRNKGNTIVDSDYVFRDRKKEKADGYPNTRDVTNDSGRYAAEIAKIKADARSEGVRDALSPDVLASIKAQIKAEILADSKMTPTKAK